MESDESTANFDPEFTGASLADAGVGVFDEEDPSEAWVSQSLTSSVMHTPNGPLGSEARDYAIVTPTAITNGINGSHANGTHNGAQPQRPPPLAISGGRKNRRNEQQGSPISSSIQENFRGFSFMGESVVASAAGRLADEEDDDDQTMLDDPTTEDEYEDDMRPAGRTRRDISPDDDI